jgi:hypothetical protein
VTPPRPTSPREELGELQGRRIPDSTFFLRRDKGTLRPGDYGVEFITREGVEQRDWFVRCPDGRDTVLWVNEDDRNGNRHVVTEHEDGTITVGGSILTQTAGRVEVEAENIYGGPISTEGWHGHLVRGVWRRA